MTNLDTLVILKVEKPLIAKLVGYFAFLASSYVFSVNIVFHLISGYFCTIGVNVPMPNASYTGTGGVCTVGHRCPAGSNIPDPCPAGTYNDMEGQEDCLTCPEGYFCLASAGSFSSNPCPVGKWSHSYSI